MYRATDVYVDKHKYDLDSAGFETFYINALAPGHLCLNIYLPNKKEDNNNMIYFAFALLDLSQVISDFL